MLGKKSILDPLLPPFTLIFISMLLCEMEVITRYFESKTFSQPALS